jgi:hypothetical protein
VVEQVVMVLQVVVVVVVGLLTQLIYQKRLEQYIQLLPARAVNLLLLTLLIAWAELLVIFQALAYYMLLEVALELVIQVELLEHFMVEQVVVVAEEVLAVLDQPDLMLVLVDKVQEPVAALADTAALAAMVDFGKAQVQIQHQLLVLTVVAVVAVCPVVSVLLVVEDLAVAVLHTLVWE